MSKKKEKKIIIPKENLNMFSMFLKYGVKEIKKGSKTYKLK